MKSWPGFDLGLDGDSIKATTLAERFATVYQFTRCHCDQLPMVGRQGLKFLFLFKKIILAPNLPATGSQVSFLKVLSDDAVTISSGK